VSYRTLPIPERAGHLRHHPVNADVSGHQLHTTTEHLPIFGVRTSSILIQDVLKERIEALAQETRNLLELLSGLSNDFIIQEQIEGGKLVQEIRGFLGDDTFKTFERRKELSFFKSLVFSSVTQTWIFTTVGQL
jgi:hypothetical protein